MKKFAILSAIFTFLAPSAFAVRGISSFEKAVEYLVMNSPRAQKMDKNRKRALINCANSSLKTLEADKKKFILAARDLGDLESRAERILLENMAAWKQKLIRDCARHF